MNGWAYYGTKSLQVCPYMPGTPVYRDNTLPFLYEKTKEEGKMTTVFCGDDLNLEKFITFFVKRQTMQVLCKVRPNKTLIPVGYCWVDNPVGVDGARSVTCGFCFFKEGIRVCVDLGRLGLAYWFEDLKIDVVHGILLESNDPGMRYALRLGFLDWGVVPDRHCLNGTLVGARIMIRWGSQFMAEFQEWFSKQIRVET